MKNAYYLSLGGNLAPEKNMLAAVRLLSGYGELIAASTVYLTPAFGTTEPQPDYLNAVVRVDSELAPLDFQRQAIAQIEQALGRVRTKDKFAARTIDIDILLVGNTVLMIEHRQIPSPEILERDFVAIPLAEIAPDLSHPVTGETISSIAARFERSPGKLVPQPEIDLMQIS